MKEWLFYGTNTIEFITTGINIIMLILINYNPNAASET